MQAGVLEDGWKPRQIGLKRLARGAGSGRENMALTSAGCMAGHSATRERGDKRTDSVYAFLGWLQKAERECR
jgi:hypothetical protein